MRVCLRKFKSACKDIYAKNHQLRVKMFQIDELAKILLKCLKFKSACKDIVKTLII